MVIEKLHYPMANNSLSEKSYTLNVKEVEAFMQQCGLFMSTDQADFETMMQVIADQLIDHANSNTPVEELKMQLKFLREVSFLLKNIVSTTDQAY